MALNAQYSFPDIPLSITNSNVDRRNALDVDNSFSFLQFIKLVTVNYEPEILQDYYSFYLKKWNTKTTQKTSVNSGIIIERYSDFLKDISIQFSTNYEKRFLSQLDFSDPYDLDVAISFYSKKLKSIVDYYNKKRQDAKFELTRKKLIGSNFGVEKQISELVCDNLENNDVEIIDYDISTVKQKIVVDVEELYDNYTQYFNSNPDYSAYDKKDLGFEEYGNVFLGDFPELQRQLFQNVSGSIKTLLEIPDLVENKFKLTQNSVGSDFYYLTLSANATSQYVVLTGKLFEATNPCLNFLNRQYPSTASTFSNSVTNEFDIGFFKPDKFSILNVNSKANNFTINYDVLEAQVEPDLVKHYYFPDPALYGNNIDIFTFVIDDSQFKHNISTGLAQGQPSTNDANTSLYGYASRVTKDLEFVFDEGYIDDLKQDIFGNTYGLVKDNSNFRQNVVVVEPTVIKNLVFDGYEYYDELYDEEYNFNYDTADTSTFRETIRSGLSSYTNSFSQPNTAYYLSMRFFDPYEELIEPTENKQQFQIKDGAYFMFSDTEYLDDTVSTDSASYNGTGTFYYNTVLSGSPDFSTAWSTRINCGKFTTVFDLDITLNEKNLAYSDTVYETTVYSTVSAQIQGINRRNELVGKLYVRNNKTKQVELFSDCFEYISSKYSAATAYSISNQLKNFDLVYNTLFLQTSSVLVIEKIDYSDGVFNQPGISNVAIQYNTNNFDKISNRFKTKDGVYYYKLILQENSLSATNNFVIYPEIYKYDYLNYTNEKIFPKNQAQLESYSQVFSVSGGDVRYLESASPKLTFSQNNGIFNISFLLKDQNKLPYLITHDFEYTSDVVFLSGNGYKSNNENYTFVWSVSSPSSLEFALSSGAYRTNTQEQEIIL